MPYTLSGYSAGVAVSNLAVLGVPVELVGKERRQEAMDIVKELYPDLIVVDFSTPYCVNGEMLQQVAVLATGTGIRSQAVCQNVWETQPVKLFRQVPASS